MSRSSLCLSQSWLWIEEEADKRRVRQGMAVV